MWKIILREQQWRSSCLRLSVFKRTISNTPSEAQGPPLLLKFRADMKNAMKAKDTNRYENVPFVESCLHSTVALFAGSSTAFVLMRVGFPRVAITTDQWLKTG